MKHCFNCQYFKVYSGNPGSSWEMRCGKWCWEFDPYGDGLDEFRRMIETAETCKHFKRRPNDQPN